MRKEEEKEGGKDRKALIKGQRALGH